MVSKPIVLKQNPYNLSGLGLYAWAGSVSWWVGFNFSMFFLLSEYHLFEISSVYRVGGI